MLKKTINAVAENSSPKSFRDTVLYATSDVHKEAEESALMQSIVEARISKNHYACFINVLHSIYETIENLAQCSSSNNLNSFSRLMSRTDALAKDFFMLTDTKLEDSVFATDITNLNKYLNYLKSISNNELKLTAHVYVRYGGDLAGGRIMYNRLKKAKWEDSILNFYLFGGKEDFVSLRTSLHELVNSIPEKFPTQESAFIEEARQSFKYNSKIMQELTQKLNIQ